jgi:pilus assembly protein Flp/PilA
MLDLIRRIRRCEQGATAVEYGLIVSLIVIAIFASVKNVADSTNGMWAKVSNKVTSVSS